MVFVGTFLVVTMVPLLIGCGTAARTLLKLPLAIVLRDYSRQQKSSCVLPSQLLVPLVRLLVLHRSIWRSHTEQHAADTLFFLVLVALQVTPTSQPSL